MNGMVAAFFSMFRVLAAYVALTIASLSRALLHIVKNIGKQMMLRCGIILFLRNHTGI